VQVMSGRIGPTWQPLLSYITHLEHTLDLYLLIIALRVEVT
jgi:hypothetical protein